MFIVGPFVESALYLMKPALSYEGPLLQTPDKPIYDGVFVGLWLVFALLVHGLARKP